MSNSLSNSTSSSAAAFNAALVLESGKVFYGQGIGTTGQAVGEVCFNTGLSGYQETLTDPSYAGQLVTFTFPHIGNVGANTEDEEAAQSFARGCILREPVTAPSNWRSDYPFTDWLKRQGLIGLAGVDTRALTHHIREAEAPTATLVHRTAGPLDIEAALAAARAWPGLTGMDLAAEVTTPQRYDWREGLWMRDPPPPRFSVVALDYGAKRNILRCLVDAGCAVTVLPASASAANILSHAPDGVFLSNGPGDPQATGENGAEASLRAVLEAGVPVFGICLGHQILARTLGAKTKKMRQGHRGANHPVQVLASGRVEITSQNHGFAVDEASLPDTVEVTHRSLFDGSNEGIRSRLYPAFSVQYHPEASPGPQDSQHLFKQFTDLMEAVKR